VEAQRTVGVTDEDAVQHERLVLPVLPFRTPTALRKPSPVRNASISIAEESSAIILARKRTP
jgi:hypothetical protein